MPRDPRPNQQIAEEILAFPDMQLVVRLDEGESPVLETPILRVQDLTDTHGSDFTMERLEELRVAYDPLIEMAALNFDHQYGGPSHGWCTGKDDLWIKDDMLWCRFGDLSDDAIQGVRSRRYLRCSAELSLDHPVTRSWYFTGLALLGNARPAIKKLPALKLYRRTFLITTGATPQQEVPTMARPTPPAPAAPADPTPTPQPAAAPAAAPATPAPAAAVPAAATDQPVQLSADELLQLRDGLRVASELQRENAALKATQALAKLGSRVTPAMKRLLEPLLVTLISAPKPTVIKLSVKDAAGKDVDRETPAHEVILSVLGALPEFEALGRGQLATDDAPADTRTADEVALHSRHKITPERAQELREKYGSN